jgi:6-phosphogluconolactonase
VLVRREIRTFADAGALYASGAALFQEGSAEALRERGAFSVALAGGSTPKRLYSLLAEDAHLRNAIQWAQVDFFWGDERHVPFDHPDSNYRMAHDAMLSKVPVRPERVHRVRTEQPDAALAASLYEADVRASVAPSAGIPRFDLVLLGIGTDGHTASLFPETQALSELTRLVAANWVEKLHAYRITMTLPLLNAARLIVVLAAGEDKAIPVRDAIQPRDAGHSLPVQLVRPEDGRLIWLLDRGAASLLNARSA